MQKKTIEEVLKMHTKKLMSISGVVGTAQGLCDGKPCIKVFVISKTSESDKQIPVILDGYSLETVETGHFHALHKNKKSIYKRG